MAAAQQTSLLSTSPRLRRRRIADRLMRGSATVAALLAIVVLGIVIVTVIVHGASSISFSFLTKDPVEGFNATGGGIANAIVGSALIVALGTAMALPFGVLVAIFLTEFATPATARPIRTALDLLFGMPTIVIGTFVYGLVVVSHGQSGWAGSFALAVIMVPLIARTTQEMLVLVPQELRDASYALGISRWRTIMGMVLPNAAGGILTGVVLAVGRAAGETAPLLLVSSIFEHGTTLNIFGQAMPNIPIDIFTLSQSPFPEEKAQAWGAALVLIVMILIGNLSARAALARQRRKVAAIR